MAAAERGRHVRCHLLEHDDPFAGPQLDQVVVREDAAVPQTPRIRPV